MTGNHLLGITILAAWLSVVPGRAGEPKLILPEQFEKLRAQIKPDPGGLKTFPG